MKTAKCPRQDCGGFGLLDVVVGTALMAVAVMAAAQLVLDTNNMRQGIEIRRLVDDRIDEELKIVESSAFSTILADHADRGFEVTNGELTLSAPQGDPDGLAGLVTVVVPDPPNDPTELLEVTVEVEWADRAGPHRQTNRILVSRFAGAAMP